MKLLRGTRALLGSLFRNRGLCSWSLLLGGLGIGCWCRVLSGICGGACGGGGCGGGGCGGDHDDDGRDAPDLRASNAPLSSSQY